MSVGGRPLVGARGAGILSCVAFVVVAGSAPGPPTDGSVALRLDGSGRDSVLANDNRRAAGTLREGVLELRLEVRLAAWRPDADVDTTVTVLAFAEEGGAPRIPGPLLRVPQGTEVRVSVRNGLPDFVRIGTPTPRRRGISPRVASGSALVVHGLRAGTVPDDTLHVPRGAVREVRFRAEKPGTYLYRGALSDAPLDASEGRDAQLAGAIVVDPPDAGPDPDDRIFVITVLDILPDSTGPPPYEDIFEMAVNGLSWPHTERLHYEVGDTVRWRWVNASALRHPMHLHGFHFRTLAKGDGVTDTTYAADAARLVVTETMEPGSTFRMEWVPARAGHWLMHCHVVAHIVPFPERDEAQRGHDLHQLDQHPLRGMAGLVLGIVVSDSSAQAADPAPRRKIRLLAQERRIPGGESESAPADGPERAMPEAVLRGFVLQDGPEPAPDSVVIPGAPILLTRGEPTAITVVNRLSEPTTVHWHGMELESVYDGVSGWSRTGARVAPLIAPGDSFVVHMTPPRAGTFIYHSHMDETEQLGTGLYGPLLVLEPGERFDAQTDRIFVIGQAVQGGRRAPTINGRRPPAPTTFKAGREHRLRIINIDPDLTADVSLIDDSGPLRWRELAKDGADAPPARRGERPARVRLGVGETYDVAWRALDSGEAILRVHLPFLTEPGESTLEQKVKFK